MSAAAAANVAWVPAATASGAAAVMSLAAQAWVKTALHTANLRADLHAFVLPFAAPAIIVSMLWHARLDADPAHR